VSLAAVQPPAAGVWRVGRTRDPIEFPEPPAGEQLEYESAGNRFDSPTEDFRTCYFATDPVACFGETLSRFRPNPALADAAKEEGFMGIGQVPADWRHQRIIIQAKLAPTSARPNLRFLDVESLETREQLRKDLAGILAVYGYSDLDVSTVRGGDRRITRWISKWAHGQRADDGAAFAGIRYLSRLSSEWECWAVFDDVGIIEIAREPIRRQDGALLSVAKRFDLTVH
jgi:hypothetical protein